MDMVTSFEFNRIAGNWSCSKGCAFALTPGEALPSLFMSVFYTRRRQFEEFGSLIILLPTAALMLFMGHAKSIGQYMLRYSPVSAGLPIIAEAGQLAETMNGRHPVAIVPLGRIEGFSSRGPS